MELNRSSNFVVNKKTATYSQGLQITTTVFYYSFICCLTNHDNIDLEKVHMKFQVQQIHNDICMHELSNIVIQYSIQTQVEADYYTLLRFQPESPGPRRCLAWNQTQQPNNQQCAQFAKRS